MIKTSNMKIYFKIQAFVFHPNNIYNLQVVLCCAKSLELCLTLCNPKEGSLPGSLVHGTPGKNARVVFLFWEEVNQNIDKILDIIIMVYIVYNNA